MRAILVIGVIFGFGAVSATGTTYYFDRVTEGDWDYPDNWTPGNGPPGPEDFAIIVEGHTCLVEDADQEAFVVEVESGATLGIVGRDLTVGPRMQVNGTVYFKGSSPRLLSGSVLNIWDVGRPGGLVTAKRADGYDPGELVAPSITIGSGIRLVGSLSIHPENSSLAYIRNDGKLVVDSSSDIMVVGEAESGAHHPYLLGSGTFAASAGTLRIGRVYLTPSSIGWWAVSDTGTIDVTEFVEEHYLPEYYPAVRFWVDGGRLEIKPDLVTRGGLEFTGGTIEVQPGKTAEFLYDPPEEEEE